jgi:hypothetical protein
MLYSVDPQEYTARRERLGVFQAKPIVRRQPIAISPPSPPPRKFRPGYRKRDIIYLTEAPLPQPSAWRVILVEVAKAHGLTVETMISASRHRPVVEARQEAMWRMRVETNMSFPAIAHRCGGRDHTTAISGIRAHERRMQKD